MPDCMNDFIEDTLIISLSFAYDKWALQENLQDLLREVKTVLILYMQFYKLNIILQFNLHAYQLSIVAAVSIVLQNSICIAWRKYQCM